MIWFVNYRDGGVGGGGSGGGGVNPSFVFLPVSRTEQTTRAEPHLTQPMPVNLTVTERAIR